MNLWFQAIFSNLFSLKMVKQLFKRWKNGTNLGNLWIQSSMFLLKLFRWASIKYLSNSSFFLVFAPDDQLQLVLRWEGNLVSILVIPNPNSFLLQISEASSPPHAFWIAWSSQTCSGWFIFWVKCLFFMILLLLLLQIYKKYQYCINFLRLVSWIQLVHFFMKRVS